MNSVLDTKSYEFALRIIKLHKYLISKQEFVLSKQVLRSGTAIGALVKESQFAQSKSDFIHKLSIALKEANESAYWLNLLKDSDYISLKEYNGIYPQIEELLKILVSSINTSKKNKSEQSEQA